MTATKFLYLGAAATPLDDGFYLPADDARHAQMWLPWPQDAVLRKNVGALAQTIQRYEPVTVIAPPEEEAAVRAACGGVTIAPLKSHSPRLRDIGPSFLVDGKGGSAAADWGFTGFGGRGSRADENFAHALLGAAEVRRFRTPLNLEGSAFVTDGDGTILALAETVFDPARNPGLSRLEAFAILQKWLGTARVIWLERGLVGDALRTDVRALATFLAPGVVALSHAEGDHPEAEVLKETRAILARSKDAAGRPLTIVDLPLAPATDEQRAGVRAYTNFLAVNGAVLVPVFGAATDEAALAVLRRAFPDRAIVPIPAQEMATHGVSLTSIALPQPARLLQRDRATTLPRSSWTQPVPDADAILEKYIDMAEKK